VKISRYFRLLPAVIIVGGGLLALKGVSLVQDARAQTALTGQAPAPEPKDLTHVAVTDPVIDDSESNSAAEVDVLTSLSKRRQQLDAREQSLNMQANLIAAAEQRVDGKIATLKGLQDTMQKLLGQRDAAEQKQLNDLVKSYSSMKPADAARIFNTLDDTVQLNVAAQMKSDVLGAILAKMQPDAAQKLTVRLANRLKLPQATPAAVAAATAPEAPAAQQMASVDPAAQPAAGQQPAAADAPPANAPATPAPANPPAQQADANTPAPAKPEAAKQPPPAPAQQAAANTGKPATPPAAQPKQQASATPPAQPGAKAPAAPEKPDAKKQASATPAKPAEAPPAKAKGA
jgi:flagellar motility protein MotE (MotC chaperone)